MTVDEITGFKLDIANSTLRAKYFTSTGTRQETTLISTDISFSDLKSTIRTLFGLENETGVDYYSVKDCNVCFTLGTDGGAKLYALKTDGSVLEKNLTETQEESIFDPIITAIETKENA